MWQIGNIFPVPSSHHRRKKPPKRSSVHIYREAIACMYCARLVVNGRLSVCVCAGIRTDGIDICVGRYIGCTFIKRCGSLSARLPHLMNEDMHPLIWNNEVGIKVCPAEFLIHMSSVESQKGVITIKRWSVENHKGTIAIGIVQR